MTGTPASRLKALLDSGKGTKVKLGLNELRDIRLLIGELSELKARLEGSPIVQEPRADDLLWVYINVGELNGDYAEYKLALMAPIRAYGESATLTETMKTAFGGVLESIVKRGMKNG